MTGFDNDLDGEDDAGALLGRDAILKATASASRATKDIPIPELGGRVRVREMSGSLRNALEAAMVNVRNVGDSKQLDKTLAQIITSCVVDDTGHPILRETDARRIVSHNPRAAFRLREAIFDISALDQDDLEELAEGFGDDQSSDSTTD